jgi:hypothetical protein
MSEVKQYFGCKFPNLATYKGLVTVTVSYNDPETKREIRLTFKDMNLDIDKTDGSWKYGPELQIHAWNSEPPIVEVRAVNNGYSRIEVPMYVAKGQQLLKDALDSLNRDIVKFM